MSVFISKTRKLAISAMVAFISPGMSKEAQEWYINLFKTLYESEEWQKFCTDDGLDCTEWSAGDDLAAFHTEQIKRHKELIEAVGASAITGE